MYQRKFFEDMQNNGRNLKTLVLYFQGSSGLGNQDLQDLARNCLSYLARVSIQLHTAPAWQNGKTYGERFHSDSEVRAQ